MCGLKSSENTIICRSCRADLSLGKSLNLDGNYKCLSGKSKYLLEIFHECTGIDIRSDMLSKCLCSKCASILIAAYEFKLMTQVSQKALMNDAFVSEIKKEPVEEKPVSSDDTFVSNPKSPHKYVRKNRNQWKAHRCPAYGCNLIFRFHIQLKRHISEMNGAEDHIFHCEVCKKCYATKDAVRAHLHQFHKEYKCVTCNAIIVGRHTLYVHQRKAHGKKTETICSECGKKFVNNDVLKRHINGVHKKQLDYECHICEIRCLTPSNLRIHLLTHTDELPYTCDICNKRFQQPHYLKLHKRSHNDSNNFECDVCQLKLKTKAYLREHRKLHFATAEFKCDQCESNFKRPAYLREHKKLVHNTLERVTCQYCNASYKAKKFLIIHMRQHTNTGYYCDQCGKHYKLKHLLRDHIVSVHDKVKNYKCKHEGCTKKYFTQGHLNQHVKTHC